MPRANSTSKNAPTQPVAKAKPTRASTRLQSKSAAAKKDPAEAATPTNDARGPLAIEPPAKPMATRTRSRTKPTNVTKNHKAVASGKENVESPALNCYSIHNPRESPIKLKDVARIKSTAAPGEEIVEKSPALNCHPVRNPPESPIKLTKRRAARSSAPQPTKRKRVSTANNQATKAKAAAKVKAKKASVKEKTAPVPPPVATQGPTSRELRAQRRAAAKEAKDETEAVKGQSNDHEYTAPSTHPTPSQDERDQDGPAAHDTDAGRLKEVSSDNQGSLDKDVQKGEVGIEVPGECASHNALKRRHEDEDDEDLQDEQEVERLSFYDGNDDSDIENDIEHKTDIPESISVFKKSKGAYKKRKMGPGFRDGSASTDEDTPADSASRAEANRETANEHEGERQNLILLDRAAAVADAPQFAPTVDADEILSRLSAAEDYDDLESIASDEELELEYPQENAPQTALTRPGTPIPKA